MSAYTDRCLEDNTWIVNKIQGENLSQLAKWGIQTHTPYEWLTYTAEELGELAKAIAECEYRGGRTEQVVHEAVQVATLALKIAEMYEARAEVPATSG